MRPAKSTNEDEMCATQLPKLPSYNFAELHEPVSHARRQACTILEDGTRIVRATHPTCNEAQPKKGCGIPVDVILRHFPTWRTLDNKVLRFFCYHIEAVHESTLERSRVRKVTAHFFLSDGTLSIVEKPSTSNSGLPYGTTVSRFKPDDLDVFSFCVGGSFRCRGLTYHIVDCDACTREFYSALCMPQPEALCYPYDRFEALEAARSTAGGGGLSTFDEQHIAMRRVMEVQAAMHAGTHSSMLTPEERVRARDYFAHDREVLRFYAVWDRRHFRLHYHLADGTIAVMFDPSVNDGRGEAAVFMRRGCVPRDTRKALMAQTETLACPAGESVEFVTLGDLYPGATVDIYSRPFFIYDCDGYTRQYLEARGVCVQSVACPPTERDDNDRPAPCHDSHDNNLCVCPVSNCSDDSDRCRVCGGWPNMAIFGSEGESRKNALKTMQFANDALRFVARRAPPPPPPELTASSSAACEQNNATAHKNVKCGSSKDNNNTHCNGTNHYSNVPSDYTEAEAARRFIVSYYLADDTLSVYEQPSREGGGVGGKIFSRRAVRGVDDVAKLHLGAVIELGGVRYELLDMDAFTRRVMQTGIDHFDDAYFRIGDLLARARQCVTQRFPRVTEAFRHYASSALEGLQRGDVQQIFRQAQIQLSAAELDAVMARVDSNHDGWVSLDDFSGHFMGQQLTSQHAAKALTLASGGRAVGDGGCADRVLRGCPIRSAAAVTASQHAAEAAEAALCRLLRLIEARRGLVLQTFRTRAADSLDGNLGVKEFTDCLMNTLQLPLTEEELQATVYKFFYTPGLCDWQSRRVPFKSIKSIIML